MSAVDAIAVDPSVGPNGLELISGELDPDSRLVTLSELFTDEVKNTEDTYLLGVLLRVKSSQNNNIKSLNYGKRVTGQNKALKYDTNTSTYDRILTFGDAGCDSGRTFSVLETTSAHRRFHWSYGFHGCSIGSVLAISEPNPINYFISESNPIVETTGPFVLVRNPKIPSVPFPIIKTPNMQRFFSLHGLKKKDLEVSKIIPVEAICNGDFCNRVESPPKSDRLSCGCYILPNRNFGGCIVLLFHVKLHGIQFMENPKIDTTFCSWSTTTMLFDNTVSSAVTVGDLHKHKKGIRAAFNNIFDAVCNGSGWSILGWFRIGSSRDASLNPRATAAAPGQDEETMSSHHRLHIVTLCPTNPAELETEEVKGFRFKTSDFV